jgi:hypothetical protein
VTRERGHYGPIVIGRDEPQAALAILRTFRSKLASIVERTGGYGLNQIFLVVDSRPPIGSSGGALGGTDQYLTPDNLRLANAVLSLGGEVPISLVPSEPSEYLSPTEVGYSKEHIGQLVTRVTRAIGRLAR